jgi:hypothetical protein
MRVSFAGGRGPGHSEKVAGLCKQVSEVASYAHDVNNTVIVEEVVVNYINSNALKPLSVEERRRVRLLSCTQSTLREDKGYKEARLFRARHARRNIFAVGCAYDGVL